MPRTLVLAALTIVALAPAARPQDGPLRRAGQNVRRNVENAVVRGQITAQEREVLHRVVRRLEWDKRLASSALQLESQAGGAVVLRGSVLDEATRRRAVDLVENTIGVTTVVDELAIVKDVKVIQAAPPRIIEVGPATAPAETRVIVPPDAKVIVRP